MLPWLWVTPLNVNADNWPIINIQQLGPKCFFGKYFCVGTDICVIGKCLCACVGSLWLLDVLQLLLVWSREKNLTHKWVLQRTSVNLNRIKQIQSVHPYIVRRVKEVKKVLVWDGNFFICYL